MDEIKLEKGYNHKNIEDRLYNEWCEKGYFTAATGAEHTNADAFTIVIPPPNVTGILHMGHALNSTMQDIVIRYQKMKGMNTLWLPGTDHAGIATQNVVEKMLAKEKLRRQDLGREKFVERVWEWKKKTGSTIINQLKKMGAACDWSRERFTMDEGLSKAVRKVFVSLYNEGLIYRGNRIINWCPRCTTALSNDEVEFHDLAGKLWHIKYKVVKDQSRTDLPDYLIVATTRPETMLGDTGIAVSPKDDRYKNLIGLKVILPLMNREIPVVGDEYVDVAFGTGAVKVTPAHDPNDFEMGRRHNLDTIIVMDTAGKMNENSGVYQGLSRFDARKKIIEDLTEQGLLVKIEDHNHAVGHCYRCDTVIEPYLSLQWFVNMKPLAELAIKAVKDGDTEFMPKRWEKTYFHWLENIRDWCISRQLWWGHRIPVWYCEDCGAVNVSENEVMKCEKCSSNKLRQEEDVLDTWFSSALWPFSTLGWPEKTVDLNTFYPTSVLVTAFDIIYLWVARMIMMGVKFMGKVPFKKVYFTTLVRDEHGEKMSKSRGNAIDPLSVIENYGTDALRFTLAALASTTSDMSLSYNAIEGYRNFANKIWNASRFALMNMADFDAKAVESVKKLSDLALELPDKYMLMKLDDLIKNTRRYLDEYDFAHAAGGVYEFIWSELCDWYIEIIKPRLYSKAENDKSRFAAQAVLNYIFIETLKVLHPFMPFISEEIYKNFPKSAIEKESLMISEFPSAESFKNKTGFDFNTAEKGKLYSEFKLLQEIIIASRQIRAELQVSPGIQIKPVLVNQSDDISRLLLANSIWMKSLMRAESFEFSKYMAEKPKGAATASVVCDIPGISDENRRVDIYIPLLEFIDVEKERERINKEIAKMDEELAFVTKKLENKNFIERAKPDVIEKERAKLDKYKQLKDKLIATLKSYE
ncbi:MAG: valine--tRNA ligase [Candidatus Wallbacteria bacterium]